MFVLTIPFFAGLNWFRLMFFVLCIIVCLMLSVDLAFAGTAPLAVSVDLSFWYQALLTIVTLAVPAFLTYAVVWMQLHFAWARSAHAATVLDLFKTSAIQGVAQLVAGLPATINPVTFKDATIGNLVKAASADVQAAMKVKGITPETIGQQIAGGLTLALPAAPPAAAPLAAPKTA